MRGRWSGRARAGEEAIAALAELPLGGTAVGTGVGTIQPFPPG